METIKTSVCLKGLGRYVPHMVVTNDDLSERLDTNDEWIRTRTGIRERHLAAPHEHTSDLAVGAARAALADAELNADEIDLLVVATMTPDQPTPSTAVHVQHKLGLRPIPAFDIAAACSGFLYGLDTVSALVASGRYRHALLIGAEKMSSIVDWQDRSTCVLFGDAAAAAVITADTQGPQFIDSVLRADGSSAHLLHIPAGGAASPTSSETLSQREHYIRMNGREIFKCAVKEMAQVTGELLARNGLSGEDLACIVPHQANTRILEALASRLGTPYERVFVNIHSYGNTSAASIPLALTEAREQGRLPAGGYVLNVAFGAGLTWGATLLRWA